MATDKTITGAEAVITALVENGVEVIFGYPGGAVLPLYDAIFDNKKITPQILQKVDYLLTSEFRPRSVDTLSSISAAISL